MELIEKIEKEGKTLKIFRDEDPQDPREFDNFGSFVLNHKRYTLPNDLKINFKEFDSWEEIQNYLKERFKPVLIKKVLGYDHSGLSISLDSKYPFNDVWDSGTLGFMIVTEEEFLKEFKENTPENIKLAERRLINEFETYKEYLEGEVYGFKLTEKVKFKQKRIYEDGTETKWEDMTEENETDSCWGYFGDEGIKQIKSENGF